LLIDALRFSLSLSLSHTHTHTHTHTLSLTHTHTLSLTHTHTLSLTLSQTTTSWAVYGLYKGDIGGSVVNGKNGYSLSDYVGSSGIVFNYDYVCLSLSLSLSVSLPLLPSLSISLPLSASPSFYLSISHSMSTAFFISFAHVSHTYPHAFNISTNVLSLFCLSHCTLHRTLSDHRPHDPRLWLPPLVFKHRYDLFLYAPQVLYQLVWSYRYWQSTQQWSFRWSLVHTGQGWLK